MTNYQTATNKTSSRFTNTQHPHPSPKRLFLTILIISVVLIVRLVGAAFESGNWPGFIYSTIHILIVAIGASLCLRSREPNNNTG